MTTSPYSPFTLTARRMPAATPARRATVTVIVPCYNYARYLPDAVNSVLGQDGVDANVIVVDDKSTDESLEVARRLSRADDRVTVIANEENLGAVATFNRGLEYATGEFLVRLDADDLLTPGSLARSVAVMQHAPSVGLVYGHPLHFSDAPPAARTAASGYLLFEGREWLLSRAIDGTNVITSPEALFRTSIVDRVGGQRALRHTHDMEMWLRIAADSDVAYIEGADQAWHREHAGSLSTQAEDPIVILAEVEEAFDVLIAGLGADFSERDGLHRAARRSIATEALSQARVRLDRGTSVGVAELMDLARTCDPTMIHTAQWARCENLLARTPRSVLAARFFGLVPRLRRRARTVARTRRWHRLGVFESVRVRRARGEEQR